MRQPARTGAETVVAAPPWVLVLMWVGFPLLGIGAGWSIKPVAGWVATLPWAPRQRLFELLASTPEPQGTVIAVTLGALAGLALAVAGAQENLTVTIRDDMVTMTSHGATRRIDRAAVHAAFLDGTHLVLLGPASEVLANQVSDLHAGSLMRAFLAHGYPWFDGGDPYKDEYEQWVEGTPDLPTAVNALFAARARAVRADDEDDVARLRDDLASLGLVIRDEHGRQYWRRTGAAGDM